MPHIATTTGTLIEARHFTRLHFSTQRQTLRSLERWDLWLDVEGQHCQFAVHRPTLPAREGHRLTLLTVDDRTVGLHNLSTGRTVNYLRRAPASPRWTALRADHNAATTSLLQEVDATLLQLEQAADSPPVDIAL